MSDNKNILDRMALVSECDNVIVNLYGVDGNAFNIINACTNAMKEAGVSRKAIHAFRGEAMSGDYNNLLKTAAMWCNLVHVAPVERQGFAIGAFRDAGLDDEVMS